MKRAATITINLEQPAGAFAVLARRYWDSPNGLQAQVELLNGKLVHSNPVRLGTDSARARFIKAAGGKVSLSPAQRTVIDEAMAVLGSAIEQDSANRAEARQRDACDARDAAIPSGSASADDDDDDGEGQSQATQLVKLAEAWAFFHTPDQEAFVTFPGPAGQLETAKVSTKPTRQRLSFEYYDRYHHTPRSQALQDALGVLAGNAVHKGPEIAVYTRLAQHEGVIWLDLANDAREAVAISAQGWRIVPSGEVPVKFRRPRGMLPLPRPTAGGSMADLHSFLNLEDQAEATLIDAWLVQAVRPEGPYPVLALHGEQGAAKSTTARLLRSLIDPNIAPLRSSPKDEKDLVIAATNGWLVVLDNLSTIPDWLSDALCRLATGGGMGSRELFSDDGEVLFDVQRPAILTGITELATRSDLLDRTIIVNLPAIPPRQRKTEKALWSQFDRARPAILGALLDAVVCALKRHSGVTLTQLPRMADFATWATAAEPALGWPAGTFLAAYNANQATTNDVALETIAVVPALRALVEAVEAWSGTASELLKALERHAVAMLHTERGSDPSMATADQDRRDLDAVRKFDGWPKRAHTLSGQLRRVAPNLRAAGIPIRFEATRLKKLIHLGVGGTEPEKSVAERRTEEKSVAESVAGASQTAPESVAGSDHVAAEAYSYVTNGTDLAAMGVALADEATIALDCETTGLDPHTARLRLVTLSAGGQTYIIDTWTCEGWAPVVRELLSRGGRMLVGHNLGFDLRFLLAAGIESHAEIFDTYLASLLLDGGANLGKKGYHALKGLLERELGIVLDKTEQVGKWAAETLTPAQLAYAATDTAHLLTLYERLSITLNTDGLDEVAALEMATVPALAWMTYTGMAFDTVAWANLSDTALAEQMALAGQIRALLTAELGATGLFGFDLNLDSPKQVTAALAKLGIVVKNTNEGTLTPIRDQHTVIPLILAYRDASKRAGTYGIAFAGKHVNSTTGRIHADFRQIGAASGRMACSNPNLQNVPRQKAYRGCFTPGPGRALVKADYSQIELRLAAVIANDVTMLKAYHDGADLHTLTAASVLGIPQADVTKEHRQLAKALNFGLIYGMGVDTLIEHAASGYGVQLTPQEATTHRERFFATYPGLRRWHRAQRKGPEDLRTLTGRVRRGIDSFTEKVNTPVQGSGADGIKAALARLHSYRHEQPAALLVTVVHDEIVAECPAEDAPAVAKWLEWHMIMAMEQISLGAVPIAVETTIAADWAGTPLVEVARG